MPTASKLVGAIAYGAIGAFAAYQGVPTLPDEVVPGYLIPLSGAMGVWLGWALIGKSKRGNFAQTFTQSVVTLGCMVFMVLFSVSCWDMIVRSMRLRYDGPGEAILDVSNLFVDNLQLLMVMPVLQVLGAGAVIGAILVRVAGARWS